MSLFIVVLIVIVIVTVALRPSRWTYVVSCGNLSAFSFSIIVTSGGTKPT